MACKARETCARCLWLWHSLAEPESEQRLCYYSGSAHYHQARRKEERACTSFDYGVASNGVSYRFEERRNRPAKGRNTVKK